jgi:iron complex outermembrane receptor protein
MIRPRLILAYFACICGSTIAGAQSTPTTDTTTVNEAEVLALRIPSTAAQVASNTSVLEATALQNGHSPDLQDALNSIPGVIMETRGTGGSRRLQMRSSGLRSPFGVRNVLMLMDGFVLTNASGNSPLELWNPQWLDRLEVVKGPVGALYGNAYGGALIGSSLPSLQRLQNATSGYAVLRSPGAGATGGWAIESGFSHTQRLTNRAGQAVHVRMFWNDTPGYRQQEYNHRHQAEMHLVHTEKSGAEQRTWIGWMDAEWGLPGALNQSDASENPTRGPGATYDAHVNRERSWAGWSRTAEHDRSRNGIWVYGQLSTKANPFGTSPFFNGVKDENEEFTSLRWWRAQSTAIGTKGKLTWDQSIIARYEWLAIEESNNDYATGALRYAIESFTHSHWTSIGSRLEWDNRWQIDAQIAVENFGRKTDGIRRVLQDSTGLYAETYSSIQLLPFFQIAHQTTPNLRIFAQWGSGGSHPTSFELVDPESYQPYDLNAEQAHSLELGAKWNRALRGWAFDGAVQAYHQRVRNAISQVPGPADGIFMDNVEGLKMSGMEGSVHARRTIGQATRLDINGWLNINRHAFDPYASTLPGTPLHSAGAIGSLSKGSWAWRWQYQWFDRIKLHNTLDDWAAPQHRLNSSVQFNRDAHALQLGVRNVLDVEFSGWLQTNAFGGRYFNPAPPRSLWVSWRWKITG